MISNFQSLKDLPESEKAKRFDELLEHFWGCPLGWNQDSLVTHRSTTNKDIVDWLKKVDVIVNNTGKTTSNSE
ncbi:hypothetical protein [Vibrio owensii]|uniref:hypothetical protein n=1 Tax=Vibrio harveyi group TaxID=717610 RepID=UPI003CC59A91